MWTVLAADDEAYIREALENLIPWSKAGCELLGVEADGLSLIERMADARPDIVITDIQMPAASGFDICKYAKENLPDAEIIILTAYPDFKYAKEAIKYDVCDYVLKTEIIDDLLDALAKAARRLEKRKGAREAPRREKVPADVISRTEAYIDGRIRERISLDDVAKAVHVSAGYLSHVFKVKTGETVTECIARKKVAVAKLLLAERGSRVHEVSDALGFEDAKYFARVFKKYAGMAPAEYKRAASANMPGNGQGESRAED